MMVIRKSDLVAQVADNWRLAHQRRGEWLVPPGGPDPAEIYHALQALAPDAAPEAIATITGDARWTANICQECGEDRDVLVAFGAGEVTHPTDMAFLCLACLEAGAQLARV
ncbi:MAG: hypothetical protein WDZ49_05555 [Litorilinea sp.]